MFKTDLSHPQGTAASAAMKKLPKNNFPGTLLPHMDFPRAAFGSCVQEDTNVEGKCMFLCECGLDL